MVHTVIRASGFSLSEPWLDSRLKPVLRISPATCLRYRKDRARGTVKHGKSG